jgi:hypothetical protein
MNAAEIIESSVAELAQAEVKVARGLDLATDAAADAVIQFALEHLGVVSEAGIKSQHAMCREALEPLFAGLAKQLGASRLAASPDSFFEEVGRGLAARITATVGHKFVDTGREIHRKAVDRERGAEVRELDVERRDPVALQSAPAVPLFGAPEILKQIEALEQRGRGKYPQRKAGR